MCNVGRYDTTQEVTAASTVVRWHRWETRPLLLVTKCKCRHRRLAPSVRAGRSVPSLLYNLMADFTHGRPFKPGAVASKLGHGRAQMGGVGCKELKVPYFTIISNP